MTNTKRKPWRVLSAKEIENNEIEAQGMVGCIGDDAGVIIAFLPDSLMHGNLLAAAPELLEALEEARCDLELAHMSEPDDEVRVELGKTIIKARAAIAKAKGAA